MCHNNKDMNLARIGRCGVWAALWAAGYHRMGAAALVLACAIAFSRLYLYVHWPSDVLAGAILGAVLGWSGAALVKAASKRRSGEEQP